METKLGDEMSSDSKLDISNSDLSEIADLAKKQMELEDAKIKTEQMLKDINENLRAIADTALPDKMSECGLSSFALDSGLTIKVKPYYSGKIKKEDEEACFSWLRNNDHGDLIKNIVSATFGSGEDSKARSARIMLEDQGYNTEQKESVHSMTLKAFIREQVEKGGEIPRDLFNVYVGQRTTIGR